MAFQLGDIKISGTIDDISFYNSVFGWLVRRKGGPTRKQFKKAPSFARSRENSNEFTLCSRAASFLRNLIVKHTGIKDRTLYHRLIKLMRLLANADQTSARGQRDPLKGIHTSEGKLLLKDFEITTGLSLYYLFVSIEYIKEIPLEKAPVQKRRKKPLIFRSLPLNLHPFSASYHKRRKYEKIYTTLPALSAFKPRGPTHRS